MIRTLISKSIFALFALSYFTFALPPSIIGLDTTTGTNTSKLLVEPSPNVYKSISLYTFRRSYIGAATHDSLASYFTSGAFLDTLKGLSAVVTDSVYYSKSGPNVCMYVKAANGTSNSDSLVLQHLPSFLRPARPQTLSVTDVVDSGDAALGQALILTAGTIYYYPYKSIPAQSNFIQAVSWVTTGTKGLAAHTLCYTTR